MSYSDSDSDDELNLHVIQKQKKAQPKLAINSLTKSRHMTDYGMPGTYDMHTFDTDLVTKKRASLQAIPMQHPPGATVPRSGSQVVSAKDLYIKKHQGEMSMFNRNPTYAVIPEYACISKHIRPVIRRVTHKGLKELMDTVEDKCKQVAAIQQRHRYGM
jgi:hypothetical protein